MKTTVKVIFRENRSGVEGVLVWRITRYRNTREVTTTHLLAPGEWDETDQKIVSKSNSSKRKKELSAISAKLKEEKQLLLKVINLLEDRGDYTSLDVANIYRERQQGQLFCEYIEMQIKKLRKDGRNGTAYVYEYAADSFLKFREGEDICINNIDSELIEKYEAYLRAEKIKANARSSYIRSLRANYNNAIKEKSPIVRETYSKPFANVFTGYIKKSEKRSAKK